MKAPFAADSAAERYYYEVGFVYDLADVRSGLGNVVEKVRGAGDGEWSDLLIGVQSRTGYSTWISGMDFPEEVTLDRARFTVVSGDKSGLIVRPAGAATGPLQFAVRRCKGFGLKC